MTNNALSFEKVLAAFEEYLSQDDYVEVVKTSRGYLKLGNMVQEGTWLMT